MQLKQLQLVLADPALQQCVNAGAFDDDEGSHFSASPWKVYTWVLRGENEGGTSDQEEQHGFRPGRGTFK